MRDDLNRGAAAFISDVISLRLSVRVRKVKGDARELKS